MKFKKIKLGNFITIRNGCAFKGKDFVDKGIPVIKIKNIKPNKVLLDELSYVSSDTIQTKEKYKINKYDIIITMTGNRIDGTPDSWVGKVALFPIDGNYYLNQRLAIITPTEEIDSKFLAYLLSSWNYQLYFIQRATSSGGQANISPGIINEMEVNIPNKENQLKIAKILSKLSDKIEENNLTNNNLYDIGLSLLNNYFYGIDDKALLNKVITFVKGKKPKIIKTVKEETYLKYLTIAGLNGQESNYADTEKMLIANQDLLMVMDGASSGDIYYSDYGVVGSTLSRLDIIDEEYIKEYIFFCLKKYNSLIKSKNTGSAIPHTDKVFIGTLEIPKLDKNKQNQFKSLLEKVQENLKENEILIKLRDTLLPKLMNGEIDLENVEI